MNVLMSIPGARPPFWDEYSVVELMNHRHANHVLLLCVWKREINAHFYTTRLHYRPSALWHFKKLKNECIFRHFVVNTPSPFLKREWMVLIVYERFDARFSFRVTPQCILFFIPFIWVVMQYNSEQSKTCEYAMETCLVRMAWASNLTILGT